MHGDRRSVAGLLGALLGKKPGSASVDVAVFPPAIFLSQVSSLLEESDIAFGAQTLSEYNQGACTGELSADMLVEAGCRYVLVGHSERRNLFGETNRQVAEKFVAAQGAGLVPVLCVGETLEQRQQGQTPAVIEAQLEAVIQRAGMENLVAAVIAYEPVWAIGTGKTAAPEQAQEVHRAIRDRLGETGATRILYGGSVKGSNAEALFSQPDIDGGLVGGASLDAAEFSEICEAAEQVAK